LTDQYVKIKTANKYSYCQSQSGKRFGRKGMRFAMQRIYSNKTNYAAIPAALPTSYQRFKKAEINLSARGGQIYRKTAIFID